MTRNNIFDVAIALVRQLTAHLSRTSSLSHGFSKPNAIARNGSRQGSSRNPTGFSASSTAFASPSSYANQPLQPNSAVGLNTSLLRDIVMASLNCPGFSDKQRWYIADCAKPIIGDKVLRISSWSFATPFTILSRKPGYEEDVMEVSLVSFRQHLTSATILCL